MSGTKVHEHGETGRVAVLQLRTCLCEIDAQMDKLRLERDSVCAHISRLDKAGDRKLLGKCFKYKNCYSSPKVESDYWWVYRRAVDVDERGDLVFVSFEITGDKNVRVDRRTQCAARGEPCTLTEYKQAKKAFFRDLARLGLKP